VIVLMPREIWLHTIPFMVVLRKVLVGLGLIVGLYLIGRAIVEPFVITFSDPSTYRNDWGGPSLAGVLSIHCGFGLLSAALIVAWLRRTLTRRSGR
jgi:hypothetical protein